MLKLITTMLASIMMLAFSSGTSNAQANPAFPFVFDPAVVGAAYSPVCLAPRLHGGICYWWTDLTAIAGATRNSATFRVYKRSKICMDTLSAATGATVQIKEWITPAIASPVYSITPSSATLDGSDCVWLHKGEYWLEVTTSVADKTVVSLREVPE
jgi:hypothetical protein